MTSSEPIDRSLEGKVAVVTGAGRNVGAAVALRLAQAGTSVAAVDLDKERALRTEAQVNSVRGGACRAWVCDVSDAEDVERMAAEVYAAFGRVDILVNNVAVTDRGHTILDLPEGEWDRVIDVGLKSIYLCTKYVGQRMRDRGNGGVVVNLGSTSAYRGRTNVVAYSAAKAGVINLTRSIAAQLAPFGIRAVSVSPNRVGSPVGEDDEPGDRNQRNLLGRGGRPEDIANAIRFLVSDEASFITAIDLLVDGGSHYGMSGA